MKPRLTACLFASMLFGMSLAALALTAGLGLLVALALYSLAGSTALVGFTLFLPQPRATEAAVPRPALA